MRELRGVPASDGFAIGPCFRYQPANLHSERRTVQDTSSESNRLTRAVEQARQELDAIYRQALAETGDEVAAIFQFHLLILDDPEFLKGVQTEILTQAINAEAALESVGEEYIQKLAGMENEYFRERAIDVRDVMGRVIRILLQADNNVGRRLQQPSIVIAWDLTPSDTITLDKSLVLGFCTAQGGPTSHTAILARELGLPAAVALGDALLEIKDGSPLILDGTSGAVFVNPAPADVVHYQSLSQASNRRSLAARTRAPEPALTRDGREIKVLANVGSVEGAKNALESGADGIGLLRTEFLYLGRSRPPTEEEQYAAYREISDMAGEKPVILRTLDIGGDKSAPYLDLPQEANPFLGLRGIRLCLARPELFEPQLRAVLRVMAGRNLKIMFPMVTTLAEIRAGKEMLAEVGNVLSREGKNVPDKVEFGIMVEVPAAAILADQLAPEAEFFSIGTNDLSQYVMAADRTNSAVSSLAAGFSPAILRLVQDVVRAAHRHGRSVGVCGELAAEPLAVPILLGLGIDELSVNPPSIPRIKEVVRSISIANARQIAGASLELADASAVRTFAEAQMAGIS